MDNKTKLLVQKLIVAFVVGFFGSLITTLAGLDLSSFHWSKSVVVSLIVGALSAGVRAVLAYGPINIVPGDAQFSIGKKKAA